MTEDSGHIQSTERLEEEDAISLLDLLLVFARHKKKIFIIPFLIGCATAVYSLQVPEIFASKTTLLPPQQQKQSSAMAMLNQMGPMAGLAGDALGLQSSGELYVAILESRRIGDRIIKEFDLCTVYEGAKTTNDVWETLAGATTVSLGRKNGMITISVEDRDPQRAADMANAYAEELDKLTHEFALDEASRRRIYLENRLTQVKEKLEKAEIALKTSQEKSGLIVLDEQAKGIIEAVATIKGQIVAKEIELEDTFENMGAQLLKEASKKTNDDAGDGTTTSTVLAQALVEEGFKNVAAGADPMALKRGLEMGVKSVQATIASMASNNFNLNPMEIIYSGLFCAPWDFQLRSIRRWHHVKHFTFLVKKCKRSVRRALA